MRGSLFISALEKRQSSPLAGNPFGKPNNLSTTDLIQMTKRRASVSESGFSAMPYKIEFRQ